MSASGSYGTGGTPPVGPVVETLTGNTGGAVGPTGNNINIVGTGGVSVAGNPGTSTLTISISGDATLYTEDVGTAAPAGGNLNVLGGASTAGINMNTFGSGSTIDIILNDSLLFPNTNGSGTEGVLFWGGDRFVHNYGTLNTFVGANSGNLTLTTADAIQNVGIGGESLSGLTTGTQNTGLGYGTLVQLDVGSYNTALGSGAFANGTGDNNTAIGAGAIAVALAASDNIAIGFNAALGLTTTESDNIIIGNVGQAGDNNLIRLGTDGSGTGEQNATYIAGIYNASFGSPSGVVQIDSTFKLGSSAGTDGQLLIGGTGVSPVWANLQSAGASIVITNTANAINLEATGTGAGASQFPCDVSVADEAAGVLNVFGGNSTAGKNIFTSGSGNTVEVILEDSLLFPNTVSTGLEGVLFWGGNRFVHNYGANNTFIGQNSGNLTLTTLSATGNSCLGTTTGQSLTTGSLNCFVGESSGELVTTGQGNSGIGFSSLGNLVSGSYNTALGYLAGTDYDGAETSNILISNYGTIGESNTIRIGTQGTGDGQQNAAYMAGVYEASIGATNLPVYIDSTGKLGTMEGTNPSLAGSSFMAVVSPFEPITGSGTWFMGAQFPMVLLFNTFASGSLYLGSGVGSPALFTVPLDGYYSFTAVFILSNSASASSMATNIVVNGTNYIQNYMPHFMGSGGQNQCANTVTGYVQLSAGDTVSVSMDLNISFSNPGRLDGNLAPGFPYQSFFSGTLLQTAP